MTENKLREILRGGSSICTRISSRWGLITELAAYGGCYDYIEYLAEYAPLAGGGLREPGPGLRASRHGLHPEG